MESYLDENFSGVKPKHSSDEVLQRWRNLCSVVKNPKRRFRFTANLSKRGEAAAMRRTNQEKLRIAVLVSKAALQFIQGVPVSDYVVPEEIKAAGFQICADELGSIVEGHDVKKLKIHGGVDGIAEKLSTSTTYGLTADNKLLNHRQEIYGINKFTETQARGFLVFVWEALHDMTLIILAVCALVSLIVGIAMEGWPVGAHDGLGIVASILLVVLVTATSDYRQSLQFRDLDKEKKKISIQMMITTVGMRTQWGKLMATLSEGGDDETPLQVKLNGVATFIGKIGLVFAVVTFAVLVQGLFNRKLGEGTHWSWSGDDALEMLEFFAIAVTIVVALVRHLAAYSTILGSPTDAALLEFGLFLEGGLRAHTKGASEIILAACDKMIDSNGEVVPLDEASIDHLKATINQFASEALRTLCLAYMELENGEKSEEELFKLIPKIQVMARSSPLDKHTLVKHLRTTFGEVVAVTGDGTNDAPALHEADIGLAMGIAGTEVAKESADVIILDDNFSTIATVAKWGRSVYINIQKFVQFQLTVNVVALIVNFSSACLTGNAPLTAVQLLWVNMIMDTLGALALATEPPTDDLMKRAPVGRRGNFISNVMWRNILGQSLYQFLVIWYLQVEGKAIFQLNGPDSDLILNTLIFNSFVFCQVFNEISSREMEKINVFKGILDNYVFAAVLTSTVLFQIIIIEYLGTYANTSPLTLSQWFLSVFIGFLGMPIAAALKMIPVASQ
ncbi:unnamed protein product, partial [Vitis vinifera]